MTPFQLDPSEILAPGASIDLDTVDVPTPTCPTDEETVAAYVGRIAALSMAPGPDGWDSPILDTLTAHCLRVSDRPAGIVRTGEGMSEAFDGKPVPGPAMFEGVLWAVESGGKIALAFVTSKGLAIQIGTPESADLPRDAALGLNERNRRSGARFPENITDVVPVEKRGPGRPRKLRPGYAGGPGAEAFRMGTSLEFQTIVHMNLARPKGQVLTEDGLEFNAIPTRRKGRIAPKTNEISDPDQVGEYVQKVMRHRGPMAVKALFGIIRFYEAKRGLQNAGTERALVADIVPYCGYKGKPNAQTIKDVAHGLFTISKQEVEVETVLKWRKNKPEVVSKVMSTALNLERRGFLRNLFDDDPEDGEPETYWVEFSLPEWVRAQLSSYGQNSQMWWPMVDRILSYDSRLERPQFCLGLYLAPILRMGDVGTAVTRSAADIASKSGWEPGNKTTRWLDDLKRFLVQLHEDMPAYIPAPSFADPITERPMITPAERFKGFRVTWVTPDQRPLLPSLPGPTLRQ